MKAWTIDELLDAGCCYKRQQLEDLFAGRESVTVLEILDCEAIPIRDRILVGLRDGEHVQKAMTKIVTRAVTNHALHCGVAEVEAWAAQWLEGSDRSWDSAEQALEAAASWASWAAAAAAAEAALSSWAELRRQIEDLRDVVFVELHGSITPPAGTIVLRQRELGNKQ